MKIDTSKISGYEDMTPEQKLAALEAFEYDDNAKEVERYKNAVTKANSEAAEWKRKHNALLSDEDKKKAENEEELNNLKQELAEMKKKEIITGNKAQLLALGYDEALADDTAKALSEGDTAKVFENQKKFLESHDKAYKAQLMTNGVPKPTTGNPNVDTSADYQKQINESLGNNDMLNAVRFTREQFEAQKNNE